MRMLHIVFKQELLPLVGGWGISVCIAAFRARAL